MNKIRLNAHDLAWFVQEIHSRIGLDREERQALSMQKIVLLFKDFFENKQTTFNDDLIEKFKLLSEERLEYYQSSRFGFIIQFFSRLSNWWKTGEWKSSADLGLELSESYLAERHRQRVNASKIQSEDIEIEDDAPYFEEAKVPKATKDVDPDGEVKKPLKKVPRKAAPQDKKENKIREASPKQSEEVKKKADAVPSKTTTSADPSEDSGKSEVAPDIESSPALVKREPMTPKEEFCQAIHDAWHHATQHEREWIQSLFSVLTTGVDIVKWDRMEESDEYFLEIAEETSGTHPNITGGKLVVKQKMKISFSEQPHAEREGYLKIVKFPDKGLCCRLGMGWFSKDIALDKVTIESHGEERVSVEAWGYKYKKSPEFILDFLKLVQWNS